MQKVGLIILGAIIALGTSVVLELYRQSVIQKRIRALLSTLLLDEIETLPFAVTGTRRRTRDPHAFLRQQ